MLRQFVVKSTEFTIFSLKSLWNPLKSHRNPEFTWISSDCYGISSDCYGISSDCYGISSDCYGISWDCYGTSCDCYGISVDFKWLLRDFSGFHVIVTSEFHWNDCPKCSTSLKFPPLSRLFNKIWSSPNLLQQIVCY